MLIEILSSTHAKGELSLNDFRFGAFVGRFQSDRAEIMAVKGLIYCLFVHMSSRSIVKLVCVCSISKHIHVCSITRTDF